MKTIFSSKHINNFLNKGSQRTVLAKKNVYYSFGLRIISLLIGFVQVPLILNYVSKEEYGVWLILASFIQWLSFFDIGLGKGLRNKLTIALANQDYHYGQKLVSTTYALLGLIFGSLAILFVIVAPFINWESVFNTSIIDSRELLIIVISVFSFISFRFILKIIQVVFLSDQRPAFSNAMDPIANIISLLIIIVLINTTEGSLLVLSIILSSKLVVIYLIASIIFYNKRYKNLKPQINKVDFQLTGDILKLGSKFFALQIIKLGLFSSANFIIAQVLSPEDVVPYHIIKKYAMLPTMFFAIIISPVWNAVTDAEAKADFTWIKKALKALNKIVLVFLVLLLFMFLIRDFIIDIWVGDKVNISFGLAISTFLFVGITIFMTPYENVINGFGRLNLGLMIGTVKLLIFLPLAIVLTKYFQSASGLMIANIVVTLIGGTTTIIQTNKLINGKAKGIWGK